MTNAHAGILWHGDTRRHPCPAASLTQSRDDKFLVVEAFIDGRCHDLDLWILLGHHPQSLRSANHVCEDDLCGVDPVSFAHQHLDGGDGRSTRGQHRVTQQDIGRLGGSHRRGELAVIQLGDLVGMRFVPLDEDLADPDRRLDVPDHLQQGIPAPNDRHGADLRGIGTDASRTRSGFDARETYTQKCTEKKKTTS